jgi:hypothetical protein
MSIYSDTIEATGTDPKVVDEHMIEMINEPCEPWFGIRSQTNALRWSHQEARIRAGALTADAINKEVDDYTGAYRIVPQKSLLGLDEEPEETPIGEITRIPRSNLANIHLELVTAEAAEIERAHASRKDYSHPTDIYAALADLAPDDVTTDDAQPVHAQMDGQTVQAEILPPELTRPRRSNSQFKKGGRR